MNRPVRRAVIRNSRTFQRRLHLGAAGRSEHHARLPPDQAPLAGLPAPCADQNVLIWRLVVSATGRPDEYRTVPVRGLEANHQAISATDP